MKRSIQNPSQRAFTLMELLIVMAIIAVLLSILVPVVSRARDQANRTACAANQRQLIQAVLVYVQRNDGFLPFPSEDSMNTSQWKAPGWLYDENKGAPRFQNQVEQGSIWPFLNTYNVYHCPSDKEPYTGSTNPNRNSHNLSSYMMNWAVGEFGHGTEVNFKRVPAFKLARMPGDGICFWEGDEKNLNVDMWSDGTNFPDNGLSKRHGKGATVVCFDGSAVWITHDEFMVEYNKTTRSRLWCNPASNNGR